MCPRDARHQCRQWRKYKAEEIESQSTCVDIEKSICFPARSKKANNGCNARRRTTRTYKKKICHLETELKYQRRREEMYRKRSSWFGSKGNA